MPELLAAWQTYERAKIAYRDNPCLCTAMTVELARQEFNKAKESEDVHDDEYDRPAGEG